MNTNELLAAGAVAGAHGQHIGIGLVVLALLVLGTLGFGAVRLNKRLRLNRQPRPVTKPEPPIPAQEPPSFSQPLPSPGPVPARRASFAHPNGGWAVETHGLTKRLELEVGIGFLVGLGLGSLTGQRTTTTIVLIALEIIVTPLLARVQIPYFIDGQRLVVGIAMDQLRPAALAPASGGGGPGHVLFGGRGALGIPPMPAWAMISVIVGWIVSWSAIGAWRMMTRDA